MEDESDEQPDQATTQVRTTGNNVGLTQAYLLRDLAARQALGLQEIPLGEMETQSQRAQALSALVRAWETAIDRIRVIRGKPLPGSLRPTTSPSKRRLGNGSAADRLVPMLESAGQSAERVVMPSDQVGPSPEMRHTPNDSTPHTISPDEYAKRIPEPGEKVSCEKPDDSPR